MPRMIVCCFLIAALSCAGAAVGTPDLLPSQNDEAALQNEARFYANRVTDRLTLEYSSTLLDEPYWSRSESESRMLEVGAGYLYRPQGRYRNEAVPFFFVPYNHYASAFEAVAGVGGGTDEVRSETDQSGNPSSLLLKSDNSRIRMGAAGEVVGDSEYLSLACNYLREKPEDEPKISTLAFLIGTGLYGPHHRLGAAFEYMRQKDGNSAEQTNPNAIFRGAVTPTPFLEFSGEYRRLIMEDRGLIDHAWQFGARLFARERGLEFGLGYGETDTDDSGATKDLDAELGRYHGISWIAIGYHREQVGEGDAAVVTHTLRAGARRLMGRAWYLDGAASYGWANGDYGAYAAALEYEIRQTGVQVAIVAMY